MKTKLLRWDSNLRHTAYETDALPTELPRQLSWLGRIKAIQGKDNQSNQPDKQANSNSPLSWISTYNYTHSIDNPTYM